MRRGIKFDWNSKQRETPGTGSRFAERLYFSIFEGVGGLRSGELAGNRTQDPRIKSALLYQLSYELLTRPSKYKGSTEAAQPPNRGSMLFRERKDAASIVRARANCS
jgi:hypothetical protein